MSVICQYVSIQDSKVTGVTGYAKYSVNAGNNTNWSINPAVPFSLNYLNIVDSNVTPIYWYAGSGSVTGGNDTGWIFGRILAATDTEYVSLADIQNTQFGYNSAIV